MHSGKKNPLERFLNIFTDVRAGEGGTTVLLTLNVFLILTAYYILKPVREALILSEQSAEIKSYAAAGQAVLLLFVVPAYALLASRVPRRLFLNVVTLFFVACLAVFFILGSVGMPLAIPFFLWVGIFSLVMVAMFWSFANDLHTPEEGKRLFAIIAFGGSAGAMFGSLVLGEVIDDIGVHAPFLLAGAVLLLSLALTNWVDAREKGKNVDGESGVRTGEVAPVRRGDAFKLVLKTRYLFLIAMMILILNWVNTTGEYILARVVEANADRAVGAAGEEAVGEFVGAFYADFYLIVNIVGLVIQLFLVSRIVKYAGVRAALLILPLIAALGYTIILISPILSAVRWAKTAENATDYSLMNTLRGVLFLPTTREQKYKAKQAIDTFFVRAGDVLSAGVVALGTNVILWGTKGFAAFNLVLVAIWIFLAYLIGTRFQERTAKAAGEAREGDRVAAAENP